ncbi:DNA polymerase IV [Dehalococcoidia bacterium]|nr:DNA polymerase IV [Dehalococcoidia bacterium]
MDKTSMMRHILHADLDAFYASVEQMDNHKLQGKCVLVGMGPNRRGVVAACSYEARAYGIHSAMPMSTALKLCPNSIMIAPRFDRYRQVSHNVMAIFYMITPLVEPLSLDEAYLDITSLVSADITPMRVAEVLKQQVKREIGLTISVGVATSKSVAKIASEFDKPDGLVVVPPGQEQLFLAPLPVRQLPGIGPKTEQTLINQGITTIGKMASQTEDWAGKLLGKRGLSLISMSRGQDNQPVITTRNIKSISAETTFSNYIQGAQLVYPQIDILSQSVAIRLGNSGLKGKTVTVKLRLSDFSTFTKGVTLTAPISNAIAIADVAKHLASREFLQARRFRLVGVVVSNFCEAEQLKLFDIPYNLNGSTSNQWD